MRGARALHILRSFVLLGYLGAALGGEPPASQASASPDRIARVITALLRWVLEGHPLPADTTRPAQPFPDRGCAGLLDPDHPPEIVYVSWRLSGEGQEALCNWKYDVRSRTATPLTSVEAEGIAKRIASGSVRSHERAYFHSSRETDRQLTVSFGYCRGSASGTFAFSADGPVLTSDLSIHTY